MHISFILHMLNSPRYAATVLLLDSTCVFARHHCVLMNVFTCFPLGTVCVRILALNIFEKRGSLKYFMIGTNVYGNYFHTLPESPNVYSLMGRHIQLHQQHLSLGIW